MLTELLGFYAGIICITYGGSGPRGVQNSNSELPESVICKMLRGSRLGGVQNSNSEHLRGSIYFKIQWMDVKYPVEGGWAGESGGRAEL